MVRSRLLDSARWQDLWDIIGHVQMVSSAWGRGPVFDRWTYWEKFDYWAPFWGVTIIGLSGLMLWFPDVTASFLPGWVFNVATIFHGEEALLAALFLFTVHFFNNHFRPDKFPLDVVMFTGSVPLEEFKHEHTVEYNRLVETGELSKYLVDEPSRPMALGSKILGFSADRIRPVPAGPGADRIHRQHDGLTHLLRKRLGRDAGAVLASAVARLYFRCLSG